MTLEIAGFQKEMEILKNMATINMPKRVLPIKQGLVQLRM
jgi:hypothetical protein